MPEDSMGINETLHIVLRGPDGKIKDERKPRKAKKTKEFGNVRGKRPGTS